MDTRWVLRVELAKRNGLAADFKGSVQGTMRPMRVAVADTAHTECVERFEFDAIDGAIGMADFDGRRFHFASTLLPLEFVTNVADLFRFDDVRTPRGRIG
ncbi:unannotated protein [freshwater metagenome]|uniref:Unannotated protein n=1 Tax=freshwater metagenome TaxID=449393 RepID=A0A6J6J6Z6_9ZZZZ